jgi:indolepyruvate ferredoxin oxidoreductase
MAAHLEGKGIVTQDAGGLAQKGGATWSHIQIADRPEAIFCSKVGTGEADLVIACDAIVGAKKDTLTAMREGRSFVALNTHGTPTAAFVHNPDWQFPGGNCENVIEAAVGGAARVGRLDAQQLATALLGDAIYANPLLLGYAWQRGWVPLEQASLRRAIELNGVQVANNLAAFEWGRRAAHDLAAVQALTTSAQVIQFARKPGLDETIDSRVRLLTGYQNAAYAAAYRAFVDKVWAAEAPLGSIRLTEVVARYLYKLMAYKDEYEVARLHTDPAFHAGLAAQFEGDIRLGYHLAPPLLAKKNDQGELIKQPFGPWMLTAFRLLARLKGLRGTALDPFGRTEERRAERALIGEYRACIEELLTTLNAGNVMQAAEIARIPEEIRGYGHVKERHLKAARARWGQLMATWRSDAGTARVAA